MKTYSLKWILAVLALLFLSGCSVGPNYKTPQQTHADDWSFEGLERTSLDPINTEWWSIFGDPLLRKYIDVAVRNNKDLEIALANIKVARALRKEQAGAFWPSIGGNASGERNKSSSAVSSFNGGQIRNIYEAGFDASWEIDIFGGNRRSLEAATAREEAIVATYHDVLLSTLSEVARTYYEARGIQKQIVNLKKNTQLLKETLEVVRARMIAGETSQFDLMRAKGEYESSYARIPNFHAALRSSIFTLSVLLGQSPEALLQEMEVVESLPAPPDVVPVGLRSEILRRRPDIRIAERNLAASIADIGAQTAELFPSFFLTGDIGSQTRLFGDLFSSGGGVWSIASLINWSLFEGGAIRARIDVEEAESEAALAAYEKSVLEALRDAETALVSYGEELKTRRRLAQGVESRRAAVSLAKELFNAGEEDYLAVVDTERQLIESEDDLIASETKSITKLIALYTSLGGGWEVFER